MHADAVLPSLRVTLPPARVALLVVAALVSVAALSGCSAVAHGSPDGRLRVVATTPVVADFAREIGGERVAVYDVVTANFPRSSFVVHSGLIISR